MNIKQVIVIRKDLNMRKGKMAAQAAHASMKVFFDAMWPNYDESQYKIEQTSLSSCIVIMPPLISWTLSNREYFQNWIEGSFKKICVSVDSEKDLNKLYKKAKKKGIHCAEIIDCGLTEFGGVPTKTCIAIGPWDDKVLDKITGKLPLL